ncbi:MAG: hypothetical protein K2W33_12425 [Burkholderiales bacterium]|nr:hypothetical protein [Burkholderiales bacterium]
MPMLVRTPEEILQAEKKDLYILRSNETERRNAPGLVMIKEWIKEHLPGTHMELIGPSAYSGMIIGGIGRDIWVNFSPEGLAAFCAHWEKDDQSLDPRFQCFVYPYAQWYQEHGRFVPTRDKPSRVGITQWWYTPLGFIHHTLSEEDSQGVEFHPADIHDILRSAKSKWPELKGIDFCAMTHGSIYFSNHENRLIATYGRAITSYNPHWLPTEGDIRDWFCLPPEFELLDATC